MSGITRSTSTIIKGDGVKPVIVNHSKFFTSRLSESTWSVARMAQLILETNCTEGCFVEVHGGPDLIRHDCELLS